MIDGGMTHPKKMNMTTSLTKPMRSEMPKTMQEQLDDVRFKLNRYTTQPTMEVEATSYGRNPDTGELNIAIILSTEQPMLLIPGMKILIVPE